MSLDNADRLSVELLLENLDSRLAATTALIYQNKHDDVFHSITKILSQISNIRDKIRHLNGIEWFELIIKDLKLFHTNQSENRHNTMALQDSLDENIPHLERFRRDEKNKQKNNRTIPEELFSTATSTSEIAIKFELLPQAIDGLLKQNKIKNQQTVNMLQRVESVAKDCEGHSFLSISLSGEIIFCSIAELQVLTKCTADSFEFEFPGIEACLLGLDNRLEELYAFMNIELQANYSLTETRFEYCSRYSAGSIFNPKLSV